MGLSPALLLSGADRMIRQKGTALGTQAAVRTLLQVMATTFRRPSLRKHLRWAEGWIDFSVGIETENGSVAQTIVFKDGKARVHGGAENAEAVLIYKDESVVWKTLNTPPNETLLLLMRGEMRVRGNMNHLSLFFYLLSILLESRYKSMLADAKKRDSADAEQLCDEISTAVGTSTAPIAKLTCRNAQGVSHLEDAYLANYDLSQFPRLAKMLHGHHHEMPEICPERPLLLTRWYRAYGFETQKDGTPWDPVLRQGYATKHLMSERQPIIAEGALLGGTTTSKPTGVVLYPDAHASLIWGEMKLLSDRLLNPYTITPEAEALLHNEVFPFWSHRNFKEWVRDKYDTPLCQEIDERFAVYFAWKSVALSHTVGDFPRLLVKGTTGIIADIDARLDATEVEAERSALLAMRLTLEGLEAYADNLAMEAEAEASTCDDPRRRDELLRIAASCRHVPRNAARTLHEALQAVWIGWIGLHMENTNAGLSIGRLDQWLQPYFDKEINSKRSKKAKQAYIRESVELVGDFYMRLTDHLPLVPDIGNYLFGGSSSDQAITLGGVTPEGDNAVNDMTYILLLVTEMLKLRDPNVNARYSAQQNDDAYLQRLCEVNLITTATPSIHGDENVIASLADHGYPIEEARDWSAIGCVEPTISGKHIGHTGSLMFNMVAAIEMVMYDGYHPLMDWHVGPKTGKEFDSFEAFFDAYASQLRFLVDHAVQYNNLLAEAHAAIRPTPLLSAMIDGCIDKALDVTSGGAQYNTSGVACIGLSDVVDSLLTIKTLVFERNRVTLDRIRVAISNDFNEDKELKALIDHQVPKYGSGNEEALALANRVTALVHGLFGEHKNLRGGRYTTGFWSMSNHVAFGNLTGALPSGRRAYKAFTPGLTPAPGASPNLMDNLRDVALLDPTKMDNNIAFNVKYVPAVEDQHRDSVRHMSGYVGGYVNLGGMQVQLNVVSSAVLRDAMLHPENYRDLLVRISGYNAYFVTLNRAMQVELIERAEYAAH